MSLKTPIDNGAVIEVCVSYGVMSRGCHPGIIPGLRTDALCAPVIEMDVEMEPERFAGGGGAVGTDTEPVHIAKLAHAESHVQRVGATP